MVNLEGDMALKKATLILIGIGLVIFALGLVVGNTFFWNKFDRGSILDKDILVYEEVLKKDSNNQKALVELGAAYLQSGKYEKSFEVLQRAVATYPNNLLAHFNLATVLEKLKLYDKAEQEYKDILARDKAHKQAGFSLGKLYVTQERWDLAIEQLNQVSKYDGTNADIYCLLGLSYEKKGYKSEALAAYQRALQFVPTYAEAKEGLYRVQ